MDDTDLAVRARRPRQVLQDDEDMCAVHQLRWAHEGGLRSVATTEEQQHMLPDDVVGALPIDILLWVMEAAELDDPGQRAWWANHRSLIQAQTTHAVGTVAPTTINMDNDNNEMVGGDANAEVVDIVGGASGMGSRTMPLEVDDCASRLLPLSTPRGSPHWRPLKMRGS